MATAASSIMPWSIGTPGGGGAFAGGGGSFGAAEATPPASIANNVATALVVVFKIALGTNFIGRKSK